MRTIPTPRPSLELPTGRRGPSGITHELIVDGSDAEILWEQYYEAFAPLEELALLSHMYPRATFDDLLADARVVKIVAWRNGRPAGLSMVTNRLEVVPQISPAFLRRRYPDQAEREAIWFGIILFVAPALRRSTVFARLMLASGELAASDDGVIVMDVCEHNLRTTGWEANLGALASLFPRSAVERIDSQSYWGVTLPESVGDGQRWGDLGHGRNRGRAPLDGPGDAGGGGRVPVLATPSRVTTS